MIKDIEDYAKENNIPIIEKEGKDFLINYIKENNIKNILELGSAIGYSAIMMALVASDIIVDTIERDSARYNIAKANISELNLTNQINIYNEDALKMDIKLLKNEYDLIFIDAAKAQYRKFFEKYEVLLNNNGTIIVDNVNFHGFVYGERTTTNRNTKQLIGKIKKFNDWILLNENYNVTLHDVGDGIFVIRRKINNEN